MTARILIADDQPDILEALRLLAKSAGYAAETVSSPAAVLASLWPSSSTHNGGALTVENRRSSPAC